MKNLISDTLDNAAAKRSAPVTAVILVADDDNGVRLSMLRMLRTRGYNAFEAATAAEALQKAQEIHPDVILMDLHMRDASGIDATREIKRHPQLQYTSVIAISATPPEWNESLKMFATVLLKPCSSAQILEAIENSIRA